MFLSCESDNFYMNIFQPDMKQNIYAYEMTAADRLCWQEGITVFPKKSWYEDYKAKRKSRVKCFLKMRRQLPKSSKPRKAKNHIHVTSRWLSFWRRSSMLSNSKVYFVLIVKNMQVFIFSWEVRSLWGKVTRDITFISIYFLTTDSSPC